ncbi:hypothetical protein B0O99DRAFT_726967 [Bisporella sp. PMI_857]|nr:hypothetical protein B0O99DRAFT_726967 [Bisporella sp. PMI_857]
MPNGPAPTESEGKRSTSNTVLSAPDVPTLAAAPRSQAPRRKQYYLRYHLSYLFLGFLAICVAGYVLSQAATNITDQFVISDVLFGVIILAIATTLPKNSSLL